MASAKICTVTEVVDESEKCETDLEHALAVAGFGCYNLKYCLVLALFLISAIIEPVGYSFVLPAANCDLQMTYTQRGFLASVPYIGIVLTSYPWGYLVDTQGRKKVAIYSALGTGVFAVLAAFMPELISYIICKFISSLCLAGPAAVPYTYIGEIIPQKHRDITLTLVNAMQILGSVMVPLLAWPILTLEFTVDFGLYYFRPWRLLVIIYGLFFVLSAFLLSFGPESPKFLVSQGKHDEALEILQRIYGGNTRKPHHDYPVKRLKMPSKIRGKQGFITSLNEQTTPIVRPPFLKWLCLLGGLMAGVMSTLNGLNVWIPDILNRVISGQIEGLTVCDVIAQRLNITDSIPTECVDTIAKSTFIINIVASTACAVIALVASYTVKFIGKKLLLITAFVVIGALLLLINFITKDVVFAALLSSIPLTALCIGPINAHAAEIFPTHLRGMAISLTMMISRGGSVLGTNVAGLLLNAACEATFYGFGGMLILCGVLSSLLPKQRIGN